MRDWQVSRRILEVLSAKFDSRSERAITLKKMPTEYLVLPGKAVQSSWMRIDVLGEVPPSIHLLNVRLFRKDENSNWDRSQNFPFIRVAVA